MRGNYSRFEPNVARSRRRGGALEGPLEKRWPPEVSILRTKARGPLSNGMDCSPSHLQVKSVQLEGELR